MLPTYRKALRYLYSLTDYEKKGLAAYAPEFYNLDRVRHLLTLLGNPQEAFQAIHIAGTKGKGSTAAMVESMLRCAGVRTALYTSPHLHTFRERIQVNGDLISEDEVVRLVAMIQPLASQVGSITTFEVMTALAFVWFAERRVDWAVVEVGLGGRLDATNVVLPQVAVITSISLDHTAILGDTLAQIAREKAGIIKPGVPVVTAPQAGEALAVIEEISEQHHAPLIRVGRDWIWEPGAAHLDGQEFTIYHGPDTFSGLWIPLLGQHQLENATTAVAAVSLVQTPPGAAAVSLHALRDGLRSVCWPGRLEVLAQAPWVIADSAHNGYSAQKLVAALRTHFPMDRLIIVLGASSDHVTPDLLTALLSGADRAIACKSRHPRAADPAWLRSKAEALGFHLELSKNVPQALDVALADAGPQDLICCTGSVFVAAEARAAWFVRQGLPVPQSDPL